MIAQDWLRDPIWQGVGGIVGVAVLLATARGLVLGSRRRHLSYGYTTFPLISVGAEVKDRVRIRFGDHEVQDVHLQNLTIINTGGQPITPSDFERDLVITFTSDGRALSVEVVRLQPADLQLELETVEDTGKYITELRIRPLLLNPGDGFQLRLLVTGTKPAPSLSARVAGVKELGWFDEDTEAFHVRLLQSLVSGVLFMALMGLVVWIPRQFGLRWFLAIPTIVGGALLLLVGIAVFVVVGHKVTKRFDPYGPLRR